MQLGFVSAALLGLGTVNTFVGRDWHRTVDDNWPRFLETWRPLLPHARQAGVRMGIENCPMLFTKDEWPGGKNLFVSPAIWRRAFRDLESPHTGLNDDPSHFLLQDMERTTRSGPRSRAARTPCGRPATCLPR